MTDPFSIVVGVAGLLGVAAQTLRLAKIYVDEVRHKDEAAAEFFKELNVLHFNLSRLDRFLHRESAGARHFDNTSVLVSSTTICRHNLDILHEKLSSNRARRIERLRWPLSVKEHRETIQELRAFAQWIQLALAIDGWTLLSKTSSEIMDILKLQLSTFQLLEIISDRTCSVQKSVEEQSEILKHDRLSQERSEVLDWVSTLNSEQKHHHVRLPRVEGTGEWLLEMEGFERWRDKPNSQRRILCCHGIPGSGKSVLASLVVDRLVAFFPCQNVAVAYHYFDFRDQQCQSAEAMLSSLLKQLATAKTELSNHVLELYRKFTRQQRHPKQEDLEEVMVPTCEAFDRVFLVIDALDECSSEGRRPVLEALKRLHEVQSISIFVTSRPYPGDVMKAFETFPKIAIEARDPDIRKYVRSQIDNNHNLDDTDSDFKDDIVVKMSQKARNMFLLAVLQTEAVLNEPTTGDMEEALAKMPRGLNEVLQQTLSRVQKQSDGRKRLGLDTLMWIVLAERPLTVTELSEALAIRVGASSLNHKYQPSQQTMVDCCMGLVTVDEMSPVIRLVHYSVQEYLYENRNHLFPSGHAIIAELSMTYLLFDLFALGCRNEHCEILTLIADNAFLEYAVFYWAEHVKMANDRRIDGVAFDLLQAKPQMACCCQVREVSMGRRRIYWEAVEAESYHPLLIAASYGLERAVKLLLDADTVDIDSASNIGTTPLIKAASFGHQVVTQMLLQNGADASKENWYGTALHCAAHAGERETILELIHSGVDVDIRDSDSCTPLHCATSLGHIAAMGILLSRGANVEARASQDGTLLHVAFESEQPIAVIETLLAHRANLEARSGHMVTLLHVAAKMDNEENLLFLIHKGADIQARTEEGFTPLHYAAGSDNARNIQILLKYGAHINERSHVGSTALHFAAFRGAEQAVRTLVDNAGDLEIKTHNELTALDIGLEVQREGVVRILLSAGARLNVDDYTSLQFDTSDGFQGLADILLQSRANEPTSDESEESEE